MSDSRTMQQIDHDAWEAGYGRDSGAVNMEHNSLELKAMYDALWRRTERGKQKEADEEDSCEERTDEEE